MLDIDLSDLSIELREDQHDTGLVILIEDRFPQLEYHRHRKEAQEALI